MAILGKRRAAAAKAAALDTTEPEVKRPRTDPGVLGGVNAQAAKRQKLILAAGGAVMLLGGSLYLFDGSSGPRPVDPSKPLDVPISTGDMVNKNMSHNEWIALSENRMTRTETRLKPLEAQAEQSSQLQKQFTDLQVKTQENNANYLKTLSAYEQENRKLVAQNEATKGGAGVAGGGGTAAGGPVGGEPFRVAGTGGRPPVYGAAGGYDANGRPMSVQSGGVDPSGAPTGMAELKTISFSLGVAGASGAGGEGGGKNDPVGLRVEHPDAPPTIVEDSIDYLPPNSYAPARVIVGVDASAGVQSQNDPLPVVLRITGPARSVINHGHVLTTRLEGCVVNGAARGDLSAEKIYVKLAKMTCDQPGGRVAVSEVKGFISFGGKTGVRGRVVTREGGLVGQAFLAGVAGGFGRAFSANTESVLGGTQVNVGAGARKLLGPAAIAEGGFGEGVSKAGDMVSKYLIERAEQYQPVIEMPTGIDVEIVFLDGVYVRSSR